MSDLTKLLQLTELAKTVNDLNSDYEENLAVLAVKLSDLRDSAHRLADLLEQSQENQRSIKHLEDAEILKQTNPDGAVSGTNEATRKRQVEQLLLSMKAADGPIHDLYAQEEQNAEQRKSIERERESAQDCITVVKYKLEHINRMLSVMAGG
jgi:hypothetical protein